MKYKLIIFDVDGTLIDSYQWFIQTLFKAADKFKFTKPKQNEIQSLRTLSTSEILKYLNVKTWKTPLIANFFRTEMCLSMKQIRPFKNAINTITDLRASSFQLALLSSNSLENVIQCIGKKTVDHFQVTKTGISLFGKHAIIKKILTDFKTNPHDALYIADEHRDPQAALKAGIHFGFVTWGYQTIEALKDLQPKHIFNNFEEIRDLAKG